MLLQRLNFAAPHIVVVRRAVALHILRQRRANGAEQPRQRREATAESIDLAHERGTQLISRQARKRLAHAQWRHHAPTRRHAAQLQLLKMVLHQRVVMVRRERPHRVVALHAAAADARARIAPARVARRRRVPVQDAAALALKHDVVRLQHFKHSGQMLLKGGVSDGL